MMRFVLALLVAIAVALALVAAATRRFHRRIDAEAHALLDRSRVPAERTVEAADLERLPAPVRRWLEGAGVVGQPRAATVRLKQQGRMRTGPDKPWIPVAAEQYFSVDPPGFVWSVDGRMMHVLPFTGRDRYVDGHGQMLIKLASLISVADGAGPEIDQGAMLRFLSEMVWFPSAALGPTITWEAIDDRNARATMRYAGMTVAAVFTFNDAGRVAGLTADRYMSAGGKAQLERWFIPITEWRTVRGVDMPVRGGAVWKLPAGDFDYFQWEILDVEANRPVLYDEVAR